jgi:hypothetical protein
VALGVTTLLTMSTQTASISSTLPPVAYTKAIDVWQVQNKIIMNFKTYHAPTLHPLRTCKRKIGSKEQKITLCEKKFKFLATVGYLFLFFCMERK